MGVYGFLIHSSDNVGSIYFSHFYTPEGNDPIKATRQQTIVRKVIEDKSFQQHSVSHYPTKLDLRVISQTSFNSMNTTKKASECYPGTEPDHDRAPIPIEGVIVLGSTNGLFSKGLVTIWRQYGSIILSVVCDPRDNLTLFANSLVFIADRIGRKFGTRGVEKRILDEPDEIESIVSPFFHQGTPLITNHSLYRFILRNDGGLGGTVI
jgi:hypothetical protein